MQGKSRPGGWGALLLYGDREKELFGGENPTTNNRMELMAVIEALGSLKRRCHVIVHTDSQYVRLGITEWLPSVDAARLENRRQKSRQERRFVATFVRRRSQARD